MKKKILIIVVILLVFALGGVSTYFVLDYFEEDRETETVSVEINETSLNASINKIYDAVVVIESYKGIEVYSTGTGFVYKKDAKYGYILTNQHVVEGGSKIEVTFSDSRKAEGIVLGGDVFVDVAVVRVPVSYINLVAAIGNSEEAKLGDTLFTVGTPVGAEYFGTVTKGILSGKDRLVTVDLTGSQTGDWVMKVIQTDASINPGNSGGPLVNINGEVIGVNSLKFVKEEVEGMGFAIPIEYAMNHISKLEKGEAIERPLLGVQIIDLDESYSIYKSGITIDEDITEGVLVVDVLKDTPAAKVNFKKGDVIQKIDDEKLVDKAYLRYILYKYNIGDTITITYVRNKEIKTVEIKLDQANNE
ncbi:MAG: trypsin-like peptidase domain-containing protein [Bacilli bacterium]